MCPSGGNQTQESTAQVVFVVLRLPVSVSFLSFGRKQSTGDNTACSFCLSGYSMCVCMSSLLRVGTPHRSHHCKSYLFVSPLPVVVSALSFGWERNTGHNAAGPLCFQTIACGCTTGLLRVGTAHRAERRSPVSYTQHTLLLQQPSPLAGLSLPLITP